MSAVTFMMCVSTICFNPAQITFMQPQGNIIGSCQVHFAERGDYYITVDESCEELTQLINKQISEKSAK